LGEDKNYLGKKQGCYFDKYKRTAQQCGSFAFLARQNNNDADIKISFAKAKPHQLKLVKYFGQIKE